MLIKKEQVGMLLKGFGGMAKRLTKSKTPCPMCKKPLYDKEGGAVHLTEPPRKRVYCKACKFDGFIKVDKPQADININVEESIENYRKKLADKKE